MKPDHDVIGNDVEALPATFTDGKIPALDSQAALKDAKLALRGKGGRHQHVAGRALDRQLAGAVGSKLSRLANLLNEPSIGTPIC